MKFFIRRKFEGCDELERRKVYSFLNMYSIGVAGEESTNVEYFVDGFLLCWLLKLLTWKSFDRVSFDQTSIASHVFEYASRNELKISFLGGKEHENEKFQEIVQKRYPELNLIGCIDGYSVLSESGDILRDLSCFGADIVVIGMGSPLQERVGLKLIEAGYQGRVFTCGGYITQTAVGGAFSYYPSFVNRLGVRFLYRFYRERHTRRRYLLDYPKNVLVLVTRVFTRKVVINVLR